MQEVKRKSAWPIQVVFFFPERTRNEPGLGAERQVSRNGPWGKRNGGRLEENDDLMSGWLDSALNPLHPFHVIVDRVHIIVEQHKFARFVPLH